MGWDARPCSFDTESLGPGYCAGHHGLDWMKVWDVGGSMELLDADHGPFVRRKPLAGLRPGGRLWSWQLKPLAPFVFCRRSLKRVVRLVGPSKPGPCKPVFGYLWP